MRRPARIAAGLACVAALGACAPAGARQLSASAVRPGAVVGAAGAGTRNRGNFVSACRYTHTAPDDPIVHPGQPGASHSHDFFANTSTDASSSLASLRAAPSLCRRSGDTAAYWVPTLSDGGHVVRPVRVLAYYLVAGRDPATIKPFPAGLKIVTDAKAGVVRWACTGGPGADTPPQTTVPDCGAGSHLVVRIHFPDCWNGKDLDSADHRSHMAYAAAGTCPADHPVPVPHLRLGIHYPEGVGGADVTLSSGGPETAHADFFNAWDPAVQASLVKDCLNAAVTCGARGQ